MAAGTYALTIRREGQAAPLVALRDQPNSSRQAGSAIDKFSFVGSPYEDGSNVVYYVDDVVIGTDESVSQLPFVAPGRRKLFVDLFGEHQKQLFERPRCLPVTSPEDVGLGASDLAALGRDGLLELAQRLLGGERVATDKVEGQARPRWRQVFAAIADWSAGCQALDRRDLPGALARFEKPTTTSARWICPSSPLSLASE